MSLSFEELVPVMHRRQARWRRYSAGLGAGDVVNSYVNADGARVTTFSDGSASVESATSSWSGPASDLSVGLDQAERNRAGLVSEGTFQSPSVQAQFAKAVAAHKANVAAGATTTSRDPSGDLTDEELQAISNARAGIPVTTSVYQPPASAPTRASVLTNAARQQGYTPGSIISSVAALNMANALRSGADDPLAYLRTRQAPAPTAGFPTLGWVALGGAAVLLAGGALFLGSARQQNPRRRKRRKSRKNRRR